MVEGDDHVSILEYVYLLPVFKDVFSIIIAKKKAKTDSRTKKFCSDKAPYTIRSTSLHVWRSNVKLGSSYFLPINKLISDY